MAKWTGEAIKDLERKGMKTFGMAGYKAPEPEGKVHIEKILNRLSIPFKHEYKFDKKRKFRADFHVPSMKLILEYEGIFSEFSRHTTDVGYSKDTEKYNLAARNGLIVLRYTAINFDQVENDLIAIKSLLNL